jgi:hypothetical protein
MNRQAEENMKEVPSFEFNSVGIGGEVFISSTEVIKTGTFYVLSYNLKGVRNN